MNSFKRKIITYLKFTIFLAIGGILFWYALKGQDLGELRQNLAEANYTWIFLAIIIALLSHISRAIRWNMLIHPLGYRPKLYNTFFAVMIGYFANLAFPRLGEVSKCGVLNKYEKIPINKLIGTMIVERAMDLIAMLAATLLLVLTQFNLLRSIFNEYLINPLYNRISESFYLLLILIAIGVFLVTLFLVFFKRFKKTNIYLKIADLAVGLILGLKTIRILENKFLFIFHSILIWVLYYFMSYVALYAFTETANLGLLAGLSLLVFGSLGMMAPVQGGIGTFHLMVIETLKLYEISESSARAFAIILHGAQTLLFIVVGFLSLIVLPIINNKSSHETTKVKTDTAKNTG